MAQNLGDVVTIASYTAENGIVRGSVNGAPVKQFTSYDLVANQQITFEGDFQCYATKGTSYPAYVSFEAPKIIFNTISAIYGISIWNNGKNSVTLKNTSVNFDNAVYDTDTDYVGPIIFDGNSSINITSNTNGKTIIKASTLTGTVSLDVQSGVQEGDTFLIQATDNQLVITNGEWTATPSTVGNVTTYTLSKAGPSIKQRLFYTYENGNRVLRFLTDTNGKQRILGSL